MALLSLVTALLVEQIRPLPYPLLVAQPLARLADRLETLFNAGEWRHGLIAWLIGVGGLVLLSAAVYAGLQAANPLLAWLWTVFVLYLTMGFRQFSHYYTDIQLALRMDDLPHARALLAQWRGSPADGFSASEIARLAIVEALGASHRHVFGVLVCFVVLPGPCGAVLYRTAAFFADRWGRRGDADAGDFGVFAQRAFAFIDWLPLRATAAAFAIVGNFENAIYCWRTQADKWPDSALGRSIGIVLASGSGALGVRLEMPAGDAGGADPASGEAADVDFMQSAVALVWRSLLLWLLLLLLVGLSNLIAS